MTRKPRRVYDHGIKEAIVRSRDPSLFPELGIPPSTARSWIQRGIGQVVSLDGDDGPEATLRARIATLERRVRTLSAVLRLTLVLIRVSGARLDGQRLPAADTKRTVLHAVERARRVLPLAAALNVLHLSAARYHAWLRAEQGCELADQPSCPRSTPHRLTPHEVGTIKTLVTGPECRHMSVRGLALHAQRMGKVFAHPATWAKLIREHAWRRPRRRVVVVGHVTLLYFLSPPVYPCVLIAAPFALVRIDLAWEIQLGAISVSCGLRAAGCGPGAAGSLGAESSCPKQANTENITSRSNRTSQQFSHEWGLRTACLRARHGNAFRQVQSRQLPSRAHQQAVLSLCSTLLPFLLVEGTRAPVDLQHLFSQLIAFEALGVVVGDFDQLVYPRDKERRVVAGIPISV